MEKSMQTIIKKVKKISIVITLSCIANVYSVTQAADNGNLYLIIGQSNAAGRGNLPSRLEEYDGVEVLNSRGDFVPATPNLNMYSTIRKDRNGYNLGYTFGGSMHHVTGEDIKLVVNAKGSTKLHQWKKGSSKGYYNEAVDRVKEALRNPGTKLAGILWHHGESNRNTTKYVRELAKIIADFRVSFGEPNLPFVAGQLSQEKSSNATFNSNLLDLPDISRHTAVVSSRNLSISSDDTHFTRNGLKDLGDRYALEMLDLMGYSASSSSLPDHP